MRQLFSKLTSSTRPAPLHVLRDTVTPPQVFAAGEVVPDIWFHLDPEMEVSGTWSSPRGRLLEVETQVTAPGGWCALHLRLRVNPADCAYFGFVARTAAAQSMAMPVCLRSGTPEGFHDQFFARHILSQAGQSDHMDMLVPAQCPDMPRHAPWHELILFLPSNRSVTWALHDLRLIAL